MTPEEFYLYINNCLWQLEWCKDDYFETENIKQRMMYAIGSLRI